MATCPNVPLCARILRPGGLRRLDGKHSDLWCTYSHSDTGANGLGSGLPTFSIKSRGHVDGEHFSPRFVHQPNQGLPIHIQVPTQADAEQSIHNQPGLARQRADNLRKASFCIVDEDRFHLASGKMRQHCPRIVAIVTAPGENQDGIPTSRHAQGMLSEMFPDTGNDGGLGLAGGPCGALPIAHLRHGKNRHWHGCIRTNGRRGRNHFLVVMGMTIYTHDML